jgi:hypothetical protein
MQEDILLLLSTLSVAPAAVQKPVPGPEIFAAMKALSLDCKDEPKGIYVVKRPLKT